MQERMKEESESPISGPLPMKMNWNLFCSCVRLRGYFKDDTSLTSCNFRLLTWKQQKKITFAALVRTNNKFQVIIMGHGDLLS